MNNFKSFILEKDEVVSNKPDDQVVPTKAGQKFMALHPIRSMDNPDNKTPQASGKTYDRKADRMGNNPGDDIKGYKKSNIQSAMAPSFPGPSVDSVNEDDEHKRRFFAKKLPSGKYQLFVWSNKESKYIAKGDPKSNKNSALEYINFVTEELLIEDYRTDFKHNKYKEHASNILKHLDHIKNTVQKHLDWHDEQAALMKKEGMSHYVSLYPIKSFDRQLEDCHDNFCEDSPIHDITPVHKVTW